MWFPTSSDAVVFRVPRVSWINASRRSVRPSCVWRRGHRSASVVQPCAMAGRAMAASHTGPREGRSVQRLAREVLISPWRFAARFSESLGESPMACVVSWRMNVPSASLPSQALPSTRPLPTWATNAMRRLTAHPRNGWGRHRPPGARANANRASCRAAVAARPCRSEFCGATGATSRVPLSKGTAPGQGNWLACSSRASRNRRTLAGMSRLAGSSAWTRRGAQV